MVELKFEGIEKLNRALSKAASQFPRERIRFLQQEAQLVNGRAKLNTPVDTGYLRSQWSSTEPAGDSVSIFNNVEYAPYVELGHRIFAWGRDTGRVKQGEHMLRDAIDQSADQFQTDARQILARIFR